MRTLLPRRWVVIIVVLLCVAAGVTTALLMRRPADAPPAPAGSGEPTIVAPNDGDLVIGDVTVPQMKGTCPAPGACRFTPPADAPVVTVPVTGLPVKAHQSTQFNFSVSSGPQPSPVVREVGGTLVASGGGSGQWVVTVSGNSGGMWMFKMAVAAAKPQRR